MKQFFRLFGHDQILFGTGFWIRIRLTATVLVMVGTRGLAQQKDTLNPFFIETEFQIGKLLGGYSGFPETGMKTMGQVSVGFANSNNSSWAKYYNYPQTGISASFSSLGNRKVLGYETSLLPYVLFNPVKRLRQPFYFKLGLGASYFTKHYDRETNPQNKSVGSSFTWAFQWSVYQSVFVSSRTNIKLGLGWQHASSGHTSLPNYGFNSFSVGLAVQIYTKPIGPVYLGRRIEPKLPKEPNRYFVQIRTGTGIQQMGGSGPTDSKVIKPIYTVAFSGGVFVERFVKVRIGLAYRFYQHFYDSTVENAELGESRSAVSDASNVNLFVGSEFLLGHIGLDVELGVNLYKPFYKRFYQNHEPTGSKFTFWSKNYISQRVGLNAYLFSVHKTPPHNVSVGAHINANFGQADFSELSLAYTYTVPKRKENREKRKVDSKAPLANGFFHRHLFG